MLTFKPIFLWICKYSMQISRADTVGDRVEELERLVAEAKAEAQEADKRCEDVVR